MLLSDLVEKHGFKLSSSVEGTDGTHNIYKSKDFVIEEYVTEDHITCYLLNNSNNHVLDVQPNTDGIFTEWDEFLCSK